MCEQWMKPTQRSTIASGFVTVVITVAAACSWLTASDAQSTHSNAGTANGCLSAQGITSLKSSALTSVRPWADTKEQAYMIDRFVNVAAFWATRQFQVKPSVAYYDDGQMPNAYAHPASTHGATDGSIRLGGNLVHSEFRLWRTNLIEESRRRGKDPLVLLQEGKAGGAYTINAIIAHEAAHILQIKMGVGNTSRNTELQADFLAGWFFAEMKKVMPEEFRQFKIKNAGLYAFWSRGDYLFNSPAHHGTPDQRLGAFSYGFKVGSVSLQRAWDASVNYRRGLGG